jgi:tetratricopeptide (TPR) repeat protein
MNAETVVAWLNGLAIAKTGKCLSDLERAILHGVCQGQKYLEIADRYGYTEGHVKDVSSDLWQFLSQELGEKVTKANFKSAIAPFVIREVAKNSISSPILHSHNLFVANPLTYNSFIGRSSAISHLNQLIERGAKAIAIQGEGGIGKTTLAQHYLQTQGFDLVLEVLMAKETQNLVGAERVVEEWLQQDFGIEPGTEFGVSLARLKRQLHQRRVGILIDNLETGLDNRGRLVTQQRNYVELLRVLADARVKSVTLITSRDRLCESSLNVTHYRLPGLDLQTWQQFFKYRGISIYQDRILQELHRAYGGNAKAMGLLCGVIQADFANELEAYWKEHRDDLLATADLKDLVSSQADRLQSLDPQAYCLFCRLGCYRYQTIPTLPTQALISLLWDVPVTEHRQAIASLCNRSLVEYQNGAYWLHPVIRAEAVLRLQESNRDWEIAHRQAAEFWTQSVQSIQTTHDALQALEAHYHYIEIQDFAAAGRILLKSRNNQWKQYLPLGSTLYRMGLIQPAIAAITQVIEQVGVDSQSSELNNILGDVWWITGKIHEAIACQEKTMTLAASTLASLTENPENKRRIYYFKMLAIDSLLSIGLYRVDLWELTEAADLFRRVIEQSHNTPHQPWADKASICLAWVNSYLGLPQTIDELPQIAIAAHSVERVGRFAYFMQILGQTYINLGQWDLAMPLLQKALAFAETGHYQQIKARILTSMAEIHRNKDDFENAIACHVSAIDLLERIGAQCDLAEALFQQGITDRVVGNLTASQESFGLSLAIFQILKAPRQVEKVALKNKN